jgi:CHASE2 domain-containing sensor protein
MRKYKKRLHQMPPRDVASTHAVKTGWRILWESVIALCIGVACAFLIPRIVGEEFATRGKARLYAPFAGYHYADVARNSLSVLLIDRNALDSAGETWPARYLYHARLLRALARYRPKAVFFDIYFLQTRDDATLPQLSNMFCNLRQQGIPVFLGVSDHDKQFVLRPELEKLAGLCYEKVALQYTPDNLDRLAWTYPLKNEEARTAEGQPLRSAAVAIYEDAFQKALVSDENEMALTWGLRPAESGIRWMAQSQSRALGSPAHSYCREDLGVWELLPIGLKQWYDAEAEKPVCVFHSTLYANDLASSSDQEERFLASHLEGRVVMIGAALNEGGDFVLSPVHGRIPGVFLHAMALDNLLGFGQDYRRDLHMDWTLDRSHWNLYQFLLFCLIVVVILPKALRMYWHAGHPFRMHRWMGSAHMAIKKKWGNCFRERRWSMKNLVGKLPDWCAGVWRLLLALLGVVLKLSALILLVCVLVYIGQEYFHIGLMSVVDVIFFTLAAEWFEWNEKIVEIFCGDSNQKNAKGESK